MVYTPSTLRRTSSTRASSTPAISRSSSRVCHTSALSAPSWCWSAVPAMPRLLSLPPRLRRCAPTTISATKLELDHRRRACRCPVHLRDRPKRNSPPLEMCSHGGSSVVSAEADSFHRLRCGETRSLCKRRKYTCAKNRHNDAGHRTTEDRRLPSPYSGPICSRASPTASLIQSFSCSAP